MKIKIEIKNRFTGKVLFEYESENNTIKETVIQANLSSADLRGADLSYSKTSKRYIQISCIGSSKRMTTYCF